jgi:CO dehydrogenase/acetyl-CoA synthase gamma subunit (corrinoid Fe-S protein)
MYSLNSRADLQLEVEKHHLTYFNSTNISCSVSSYISVKEKSVKIEKTEKFESNLIAQFPRYNIILIENLSS